MKIIGGNLKGRNFYMPKDIRPTSNLVRKAIFDILGQDIEGLSFLELFAGSGAVGLEAFSRNAQRVIFVEKEPQNLNAIEANLKLLKLDSCVDSGQIQVIGMDAFITIKRMAENDEKFDVIFADPPYERGLAKKTLKNLITHDIVQPNALLIIQHEKRESLPEADGRFLLIRQKKYGSSILSLYQHQ